MFKGMVQNDNLQKYDWEWQFAENDPEHSLQILQRMF